MRFYRGVAAIAAALALLGGGTVAHATHAWGPYHWARTANPFTLQVGDNVSSAWDAYLDEAISDWNSPVGGYSQMVNLAEVAGGTNPKNCKSTSGRIEVCNSKYGNNGWLGLAQIWVSGSHITKGTAKMNDTYFTTPTYNTPAWRRLVMCQEIAHDFGLDHQDENFSNPNLGTCMDYTNDPDGPPSNEHPNAHDFEQLEIIYAHLDSFTSALLRAFSGRERAVSDAELADPRAWGRELRRDAHGRPSLYERDLGRGEKVFTFVIWAE